MATEPKAAPAVKVDDAEHDRVAMLSLKVDGTPDQTNPEIIGDKDAAIDAAKEQFAQKAVSAVDQRMRGVGVGENDVDEAPGVEELTKAHKAAAEAAEKRAESVVNDLHAG